MMKSTFTNHHSHVAHKEQSKVKFAPTSCWFILVIHISLVDRLLYLIVGALRVEVHRPREVHEGQMCVAKLFMNLCNSKGYCYHN